MNTQIIEDYVSFETAKLLKEKGFEQDPDYATSWYANQYYKNSCQGEWFKGEHQIIEDIDDKCNISYLSECGIFIPAPTLQMAMKWLREVHKECIVVQPVVTDDDGSAGCLWSFSISKLLELQYKSESVYELYAAACESAIKYCLTNLI